jgi:hypothetical protein
MRRTAKEVKSIITKILHDSISMHRLKDAGLEMRETFLSENHYFLITEPDDNRLKRYFKVTVTEMR